MSGLKGRLVSVGVWCAKAKGVYWHIHATGNKGEFVVTSCDGSCLIDLPEGVSHEALSIIDAMATAPDEGKQGDHSNEQSGADRLIDLMRGMIG
ncbi:MAG: hypothetical protein KBC81_01415 [Candidatus Pacebacteria bacterium]|nr:hypothetical protein [Candidatus Paceibacterota bacterium]